MENNLKLLSLAKDFNVKEVVEYTYYTVEVVDSNLFATIYPEDASRYTELASGEKLYVYAEVYFDENTVAIEQ